MTSPSSRALPIALPESDFPATPTPLATSGTSFARYVVRLRDLQVNGGSTYVAEIRNWSRLTANIRYNKTGSWAFDLDANHPLASQIRTPNRGIVICRNVYDAVSKALIYQQSPLLSGPIWGWTRAKRGNLLTVFGYDDNAYLAMRVAAPVTTWPLQTLALGTLLNNSASSGGSALPNVLRYYTLGDQSVATDQKSGQTGTYNGTRANESNYPFSDGTILADDYQSMYREKFNGTTTYVSLPTTSIPTGNGSYWAFCVFRLTSIPGSTVKLISWGKWGTALSAPYLGVTASAGVLAGTFSGDTGASAAIPINTTHTAAMKWNGTTLTCYVDGVSTATATPGALSVTFVGGAARIGSNADGSGGFFPGYIGHVIIGTGATIPSDAQMLTLHQAAMQRFTFGTGYDAQAAAVAETAIKHYILYNGAPNIFQVRQDYNAQQRVFGPVTVAADSARGATLPASQERFGQLLTESGDGLVQRMAQQGGLGFNTLQANGGAIFDVFVPADRSAGTTNAVIFSEQNGTVADYVYTRQGPPLDGSSGTDVYVLGSGQLAARSIVTLPAEAAGTGTTVTARPWPRVETVVDARDTSDTTIMTQRGISALNLADQTNIDATLRPGSIYEFRRDYNLGDTITVRVDGQSFNKQVREINIQVDSQGEIFAPSVASPDASGPGGRSLITRVSGLENGQ